MRDPISQTAVVEIDQLELAKERPKVAWLSPFPPQRSGVANYSYWLVKALKSDFNIHLFSAEQLTPELINEFVVHPLSAFRDLHAEYDQIIYHLGNNAEFHKHIYELAWHFPGTIVLHDYNLSGFMHDAFFRYNRYRQAAQRADSVNSLPHSDDGPRQGAPMSHAIVERSRRVIVHHRWARNQFADHPNVKVIPHFAQINYTPTSDDIARFKQRFALRDDHFVITCLGFVNLNKLPALQIEVVKRLLSEGYPVQLVFAGEPAPEFLDLLIKTKLDGFAENIICTRYLDEVDYFTAIFMSDIIINLRNPTMGESSGTLAHALAAGRPTIVSDRNQYREFPDDVCWKLIHDGQEAELLFEYARTLLANVKVRAALSKNAASYARNVLSMNTVRKRWISVLNR